MTALVEQGMKDGAFGLSTGLFYVPGTFTPTEEVIELARVAGRFGGIHVVPSARRRLEGDRQRQGDDRDRRAGRACRRRSRITRSSAQANWGRSVETLRLIDEARARGVDVTIDQYPYTASSTEHRVGADAGVGARRRARSDSWRGCKDPAHTREDPGRHDRDDPRRARRRRSEERAVRELRLRSRRLPGKTLADVTRAARTGRRRSMNAAEATMWIVEQGGCQGIFHAMSEQDLVRILRHPATMIASDGEVPIFGRADPAPAQLRHVRAGARRVRPGEACC